MSTHDALIGFGDDARRAVALAEAEARELGQGSVGTEHLLIGLLATDPAIASALTRAGGTVAAARHKVRETAGDTGSSLIEPAAALPMTARATRAVGRAVRFSHQDRSEVVETRHLLLGVLDVEGTAGQVVRGIGVDVATLVAGIDVVDTSPSVSTTVAGPAGTTSSPVRSSTPAICPSCGAAIDELSYRVLPARGPGGASLEALAFSCGACGAIVGVSRG